MLCICVPRPNANTSVTLKNMPLVEDIDWIMDPIFHVELCICVLEPVCCTQEHDGDDPFYIREFHISMRHYVY